MAPKEAGLLVERIEDAFGDSAFPEHSEVSLPTYDDEGTAAYFRGKTWRGHTARQLRALDFSLAALTAEAFAYFLPAYMTADIREPADADTIPESLLFWLTPEHGDVRAARIVALLSQRQRDAVVAYFEYVRERDGECREGEFESALGLLRAPR